MLISNGSHCSHELRSPILPCEAVGGNFTLSKEVWVLGVQSNIPPAPCVSWVVLWEQGTLPNVIPFAITAHERYQSGEPDHVVWLRITFGNLVMCLPSMACGHVRYSCRRTHSGCFISVYRYDDLVRPYIARFYISVRAPGGLLCICSEGRPLFDGAC
jgi:hypothetical protein